MKKQLNTYTARDAAHYTARAAGYGGAYAAYNADAAYAAIDAIDAARDLINQYHADSNDRWPTIIKAKAAGKYLYTLAKLRLI